MAEAVLSVTLETLRDLLLEEARFLSGVGNQVREIQGQLEMMKSFLNDADQRQHKEERVRTWVQQVRRLAYRTEDVLKTYAVEVVSKKQRGIKNVLKRFACILSEGKALHKVGEEIKNIKLEITNLSASRQTFNIKDLNEGESSKEAKERQRLVRQTYAHEVEEHFVGRKDDICQLVSLITDDERDHRVISICGMGGLGKTTLARKIFNHGVVQRSFAAFAWVCITQQPQIDKDLRDILKQIIGKDMDGDQTALVRELYKVLKEKKCLVVVDDIWEVDDWDILRRAFPIREASSKVLLTTRIRKVAKKAEFFYELNHLVEEDSWELLHRKALRKQEEKDPEIQVAFERIGKEIVRKCGYLPLAISALGGVLRDKSSVKEWEIVNGNIDLYLRKREGSEEASGSVVHVLALSYDELPYYLKPCFLYMGSFLEDQTIKEEFLYYLWIAEGLVLPKHCLEGESMIDVAERYLNELASRCMVEVEMGTLEVEMGDMSIYQMLKLCRLHDLMRDVCLEKGREEDFFKVINIHGEELPALDDRGRRRLGILVSHGVELSQVRKYKALFEQINGQFLRSFFVQWDPCRLGSGEPKAPYQKYLNPKGLDPFKQNTNSYLFDLNKFKLLRVLRLEGFGFELPREISQLIHLRYLSLLNSTVRRLPSSISKLPYLQILDLRTLCSTYVPNIFRKMKRLRHIYIPFHNDRVEKLQLNDLSELETLHGFRFSIDEPADVSQLVNLRSFVGVLDSSTSPQTIDQICHLRKIKWLMFEMVSSDFTTENGSHLVRKVFLCEKLDYLRIVSSLIGNFPPYEAPFLPNLTWLTLEETKIEEDPMQFLEKLPNLQSLFLHVNAFMGKEVVCDGMGFRELRTLDLYGLPNLEKWRVDEGAMPMLSHLTIHNCPKLETITDGLNFSSLKRFDIWDMPEEKYTMLCDRERKKFNG